ncbi:MAG: XdhC family protein [Betaproteobacteria bacterium]
MRDVLEAVLQAEASGEPAAMVTVVATEGSTPQKAGARMLVFGDGRIVGTIGGGCLEAEMSWRAREAIGGRRPRLVSYDLTPDQAGEDGLVCGGRMQVFIEPIEGTPVLCLFGAGHVAQPLARMAKACGFRVELADDRVKFANAERFPEADAIVVDDFVAAAGRMTLGPNSYAIVVTRGHKGDGEALQAVLGRGLRFVGLLGSKPKVVHIFAALEEKGVPREELARVHAPLGLEIGAQTPDEIAVSILAEMIAVRRGVDPARARSMKMELPGRMSPGHVE